MSIKSRLLLALLLLGALVALSISALAYTNARDALRDGIFAQLTGLRASRGRQIDAYLQRMLGQVRLLGGDERIAEALVALSVARDEASTVDDADREALRAHYAQTILPKIDRLGSGRPDPGLLLPRSDFGVRLQLEYIAGRRDRVPTAYRAAFDSVAAEFAEAMEAAGFYDLFLVDPEGDVLFTMAREVDLGTNLLDGPHAGSGLAEAVREVLAKPYPGSVAVEDYALYRPSGDAPAAFLATPVVEADRLLGVLAVQFPTAIVDEIMTGGGSWRADGLGDTGETYLVGRDLRLRSNSRFITETPEAYFQSLERAGATQSEQNAIRQLGTTVLFQRVDTEATQAARDGRTDTAIIEDYRGETVLSSFAPLQNGIFPWLVVAEIDAAEAFAPLYQLQRTLVASTLALLLAISVIAVFLTGFFTRPISRFVASASAVSEGREQRIAGGGEDEFGQLGKALNVMIDRLRRETEEERANRQRVEALLESVLPSGIAERLGQGERNIVDRHPSVTVLCARLSGLTETPPRRQDSRISLGPRGDSSSALRLGAMSRRARIRKGACLTGQGIPDPIPRPKACQFDD